MPQPRKIRETHDPGEHRRFVGRRRPRTFGRPLEHPADRIEADRVEDTHGRFDRFAKRASFLASSSLFFAVCAVLVLIWAVGLAVGASDRFVSATAGLMSAVTLILVAVLKNSELRTERALQTKLDAIASSLLEDRRGQRGDAETQLEESIRLHEQL
jgi:low affinity Fe/Cu permease